MSSRDVHDLTIMLRELRASRRADGAIVAHDIRGRRHEANVAAQWITTRARKHKEAQAKVEQFNESVYLREHLEIGISTMQTWIVILRNWPLYARRRKAAVTGLSTKTGSGFPVNFRRLPAGWTQRLGGPNGPSVPSSSGSVIDLDQCS